MGFDDTPSITRPVRLETVCLRYSDNFPRDHDYEMPDFSRLRPFQVKSATEVRRQQHYLSLRRTVADPTKLCDEIDLPEGWTKSGHPSYDNYYKHADGREQEEKPLPEGWKAFWDSDENANYYTKDDGKPLENGRNYTYTMPKTRKQQKCERQAQRLVEAAAALTAQEPEVEAYVEVRFGATWYFGVILKTNADSTYQIQWTEDDGATSFISHDFPRDVTRLRARRRAEPKPELPEEVKPHYRAPEAYASWARAQKDSSSEDLRELYDDWRR